MPKLIYNLSARKIYSIHTVHFLYSIFYRKNAKIKNNTFQPDEIPLDHVWTVTDVSTHNCEHVTEEAH
jgi:hypothetical protein